MTELQVCLEFMHSLYWIQVHQPSESDVSIFYMKFYQLHSTPLSITNGGISFVAHHSDFIRSNEVKHFDSETALAAVDCPEVSLNCLRQEMPFSQMSLKCFCHALRYGEGETKVQVSLKLSCLIVFDTDAKC